jgi:hypothetical protein
MCVRCGVVWCGVVCVCVSSCVCGVRLWCSRVCLCLSVGKFSKYSEGLAVLLFWWGVGGAVEALPPPNHSPQTLFFPPMRLLSSFSPNAYCPFFGDSFLVGLFPPLCFLK